MIIAGRLRAVTGWLGGIVADGTRRGGTTFLRMAFVLEESA